MRYHEALSSVYHIELPFECLLFHALVTLIYAGKCNAVVPNIFRLKGLATTPVEVIGYVLVISKYLLYTYYVQESLLGITEIPEHNRGKQ